MRLGSICRCYPLSVCTCGFDRIETPALEQVDTFVHGIGESTDVVRKEMFRIFQALPFDDLVTPAMSPS